MRWACCAALAWGCILGNVAGAEPPQDRPLTVSLYHVAELRFEGPVLGPDSAPARDVTLWATLRHESGAPALRIPGFWDGDGRGGVRGGVFKVRFTPTAVGRWTLLSTESNEPQLAGQQEGLQLVCEASDHSGFWIAEGRWYRRSDGSHQYIVGNTHYSFLSRQRHDGPAATDPVEDIRGNARYFKKLRFSLTGCRYPDPQSKPFLDDRGAETDDGRFSFRPNPRWFYERVDPVVAEGHRQDLICDLILAGPDAQSSRVTLKGDPVPWLRYVAARYGSYPNVWICLANEWDIKSPSYTAAEIQAAGRAMRRHLAYPTPLSVHRDWGNWNPAVGDDWNDHVIIQWKIRELARAADAAAKNFQLGGGKPLVNDENAYQGAGDNFSHADTVEGCFGTLLGGGYPTTGEKYGNKLGQYFWGGFDARQHTAAENLGLLRAYLDEHVAFWRMAPAEVSSGGLSRLPEGCRLLADPQREYLLGSRAGAKGVRLELPPGRWRVVQVDLMQKTTATLAEEVQGGIAFDLPDSRAALTHWRRLDGDGP